MTTAEKIKERRKDLGMRADDVAEKIGVSRSTMFRYENGDIEKLPMNHLVPIAEVLQTSVDYLMGWTEEKEPTPTSGDGLDGEVMRLFGALSREKQEAAAEYIRFLASSK